MSLVNKSTDWTPNYHKILIFFPTKSLKSLRAARIDELADSNEPAINVFDLMVRRLIAGSFVLAVPLMLIHTERLRHRHHNV